MKILQLTANFAPRSASPAIRTVNLAKAFAAAGHTFEVLTYEKEALTIFSPSDQSLNYKVPQDVRVTRVSAGALRRWILGRKREGGNAVQIKSSASKNPMVSLLIPDPHVDAVFTFYKAAEQIIRRFCPEVILTHGYPFSLQLVGYVLKKKFPGIKWIADYGDPWSCAPITELYRPKWREWLDCRVERHILRRVDLVTVTTEPTKDLYTNLFPGLRDRIHVLPMGYDPDDFNRVERMSCDDLDSGKLCFVHTGRLYSQARNPRPFLSALEELLPGYPEAADAFSITLVGEVEAGFRDMIEKSPAGKVFRFIPWVPVEESIAWMKAADYLVLFGNRGEIQIPGKIYQYLGVGKPILMIYETENDPTLDVIKGTASVAVRNDCQEILSFFKEVILADRRKFAMKDMDTSARFSWPKIVQKLVERIEKEATFGRLEV